MLKFKIGVDVDEVLYECNQFAADLENIKHDLNPPLTLEEMYCWGKRNNRSDLIFEYYDRADFFENQPIIEGAVEFIKQLQQIAEVYIITAIDPRFMGIRINRLMKDFPTIPKNNIVMGYDKSLMKLDMLLDDNPKNIMESICEHPVLFRKPWNRELTGGLVVDSYEEFLSLVKILIGANPVRPEKPHFPKHYFYVFVGPSGSGKTTIIEQLPLKAMLSVTTRKPRAGMNDPGYINMTVEEFLDLEKKGYFFESTFYAGHNYGTLKSEIYKHLEKDDCCKAMDIKGALCAKREFGDACRIVYVNRPDKDIITSIMKRNVPMEDKINRITSIQTEKKNRYLADFVLENDGSIEDAIINFERNIRH